MGKLLSTRPDKSAIEEGARILRSGGVIAYPTETYYGLGADPFNAAAVQRVFQIKRRSAAEPILLLIPTLESLACVVQRITPLSKRLMDRFWPGPLTIVLEASQRLPGLLTGETGTVGVRLCCAPAALSLLQAWGSALTATSANRSGEGPLASAEEVARRLGDDLDMVVDGGATPGGLPSTVVDARGEKLIILREGRIASSDLESALD